MRPTICEINLNKLKNNYLSIRNAVGKKVMAMVKADAYGHGLVECAHALEGIGVDYFGVASLEEALTLRGNGIKAPILSVGVLSYGDEDGFAESDFEQAVSSVDDIVRINSACKNKAVVRSVHLKVDTGMHRTGVHNDELQAIVDALDSAKNIRLKGVFTHFSCSDFDDAYTEYQLKEFNEAVSFIKKAGYSDIIVHCANSGAIVSHPECDCDMVRAGIILYGYYPSEDNLRSVAVEPILEFKTKLIRISLLKKGQILGYGGTFSSESDVVYGVIPVGYGDGYKRANSNKASVIINGIKTRVIGRVCMDMAFVDLTGIEAEIGDEVVLIGEQNGERVTADDLAEYADTISYEIMLSITPRVKKLYV